MTDEPAAEFGRTIQSVEGALDVVEVIREKEQAGVTEIANELGRSKSTVHHYLATLAKRDYVDREDGQYRLSLRFLALGGQVRERERLYHLGKDDVDTLAAETGEQASLVVARNDRGITLYESTGENVDDALTHAGHVDALYCTAAGKAILAGYSDARLDDYLDGVSLTPHTDRTITDPGALRDEVASVRERGVAFDDRERYEGVRCVACPVSSGADDVLGVLSVSAPVERMDDAAFRETVPDLLQNVAGVVEINTTYSAWTDGPR